MSALTGQLITSYPAAGPKSVHVDKRTVGDSVALALWTPPSASNRLVITDITFSLSLAGTVVLFSGDDAEGNRVLDIDVSDLSGLDKTYAFTRPLALPRGDILKITTLGGGNLKLALNGWME